MKALVLLITVYFTITNLLHAQNGDNWETNNSFETIYQVSFGANAVNNLGLHSPLNSPEDWGFSRPISFGIRHKLRIR